MKASSRRMVGLRKGALGFDMPTESLPPGSEEIESAELARLFGKVVGVRMFIAPVLTTFAVAWALFESAPWRKGLFVIFPACIVSVSLELGLAARGGGGCQASLTLPRQPAANGGAS